MIHQFGIAFVMLIFLLDTGCSFTDTHRVHVRQLFGENEYDDAGAYFIRWSGVLLNQKYVLSADIYEGEPNYVKEKITVVYYHKASFKDISFKKPNQTDHWTSKETRRILNIFVLDSLLLLKLEYHGITFEFPMYRIYLPDAEDWKTWKNHFFFPNNTKYKITYWYGDRKSENYTDKLIQKVRRCSKESCFRGDGLIPGCFTMKPKPFPVVLPAGGALLYKNNLMGIRRFTQKVDPLDDFPEDYYINIAAYTKTILYFMDEPMTCQG